MPTHLAKFGRTALFVLVALGVGVAATQAGEVALAWDANSEPDIAGYVIRYGVQSGNYTSSVDVGNRTLWTVTGLQDGVRHYFVVQAYNLAGLYSVYSIEVSAVVGGTVIAPTITGVSPTSGTTAGGTRITITGTAFVAGATVAVGGAAASSVTVASATSISATTPAHAAGAVSVVVTNPDGQSATRASAFTYVAPAAAPTISGVSPTSGTTAGGTRITITGTGFVAGATVTVGGAAASSVTVAGATSISATTPAHAAGAVSIVVRNADGQSGTLANAFTYVVSTTLDEWMRKFGITDINGDDDGDGVTNQAEYNAQTDPTIPNTWHLAEGATGFFRERIALANPGTDPADMAITFLPEGLAPIQSQVYVPAQSRASVTANDITGLENVPVATVITARSGGAVVERTMMWSNQEGTFYAGHTGKAAPQARQQWFFAEGYCGSIDTWFSIANATPAAGTVQVSYMLEDGRVIQRSHAIGAGARLTIYANAVSELQNRSFATAITSTVPVTADRTMYFSAIGRFWKGGTAASGVEAPALEWYVAEGHTGPFFDEYLLIQNTNAVAVTATVRFLRSAATPLVRTYALAPSSRTTIAVSQIPELHNSAVSAVVTATQPVVVERAMYWPGPSSNWYEGHAATGVTRTGTRWILAEGEHGGPLSFESYIVIANPSGQAAQVYITVLREQGGPIAHMVTVPANGRATIASTELGLGYWEQFSAHVESLNAVPIVVDRSMYWNGGALFWGGGTSETGTRIR